MLQLFQLLSPWSNSLTYLNFLNSLNQITNCHSLASAVKETVWIVSPFNGNFWAYGDWAILTSENTCCNNKQPVCDQTFFLPVHDATGTRANIEEPRGKYTWPLVVVIWTYIFKILCHRNIFSKINCLPAITSDTVCEIVFIVFASSYSSVVNF